MYNYLHQEQLENNKIFHIFVKILFILAVNCTELPVEAPNNDRGKYDWTNGNGTQNGNGTHYGTIITYE